MINTQLRGIYAAVVTPLTADAVHVDSAGIDRQTDHLIANGIHGLVAGGSTGEFTTLTLTERKHCTERYLEAAAGRVPIIAGTGALSTAETVELSKHASDAGAAAVMVVPPFYDGLTWNELLAHYSAVSDAIDVPIMYYNIPSATRVQLSPAQFGELARRTRVTSLKDTSGDATKFALISRHEGDHITALNGWDTLSFYGLALGAQGCVWGAASVIPALCAELYCFLTLQSDLERARTLWMQILPICEFFESHNYASAIKTGLELIGQGAGPTRPPVQPLAYHDRRDLRQLLMAAGVEVIDE